MAHFGTADVANEEQQQTACVLTSIVGKTCKRTVARGLLVACAFEMTWQIPPRSFLILSEFLTA